MKFLLLLALVLMSSIKDSSQSFSTGDDPVSTEEVKAVPSTSEAEATEQINDQTLGAHRIEATQKLQSEAYSKDPTAISPEDKPSNPNQAKKSETETGNYDEEEESDEKSLETQRHMNKKRVQKGITQVKPRSDQAHSPPLYRDSFRLQQNRSSNDVWQDEDPDFDAPDSPWKNVAKFADNGDGAFDFEFNPEDEPEVKTEEINNNVNFFGIHQSLNHYTIVNQQAARLVNPEELERTANRKK